MKEKNIAIVLAAGSGRRMNSDISKQYLLIEDKPILYYTLKAFEESLVDEVVLVVPKGEIEYCKEEIIEKYNIKNVSQIVEGGKERYHSVWNGIQAVEAIENTYIYIHDGVRPFISTVDIEKLHSEVRNCRACVLGVISKDTIKIGDDKSYCVNTPNRKNVWCVQTPQVFDYKLIKFAYERLINSEEDLISNGINVTDDAMVVEIFADTRVKMVEGSYKNIKITTPEDIDIAAVFLKD